jgi:class 3 adenylate cyclase
MAHLPTGTVTLLFTDIEGSTQLLQRLGPAYARALSLHQAVLRAALIRLLIARLGRDANNTPNVL